MNCFWNEYKIILIIDGWWLINEKEVAELLSYYDKYYLIVIDEVQYYRLAYWVT